MSQGQTGLTLEEVDHLSRKCGHFFVRLSPVGLNKNNNHQHWGRAVVKGVQGRKALVQPVGSHNMEECDPAYIKVWHSKSPHAFEALRAYREAKGLAVDDDPRAEAAEEKAAVRHEALASEAARVAEEDAARHATAAPKDYVVVELNTRLLCAGAGVYTDEPADAHRYDYATARRTCGRLDGSQKAAYALHLQKGYDGKLQHREFKLDAAIEYITSDAPPPPRGVWRPLRGTNGNGATTAAQTMVAAAPVTVVTRPVVAGQVPGNPMEDVAALTAELAALDKQRSVVLDKLRARKAELVAMVAAIGEV